MNCGAMAKVLQMDADRVRTWFRLCQQDRIEGRVGFAYEGGTCRSSEEQQDTGFSAEQW